MTNVAVPVMARPAWVRRWFSQETLVAWLFILPSLIGFVTFYAVPAVRGLYFSFTDWDMLKPPQIIGLDNYTQMFQDRQFWNSLRVTIYYVLLNIPAQTILAILLAVMMDRVVKSTLLRSVFILPWLLPAVIVGTIWAWILNPGLGPIGSVFRALSLTPPPFLGSPDQAMPSIALINIWQYTGNAALLVFAGLQTIPKEVYEAGAIDGASEGRMFWSITLPLLRPVLEPQEIRARRATLAEVLQAAEDNVALLAVGDRSPALQAALELASFLVARLRMGWNESGLWHAQAASGVDAAEVEALEDELYFRLRGIQRAVLTRAGELPADEAAALAALCESLAMGRTG